MKKNTTKKIAKVGAQMPSVESLMTRAIEKDASVETLEKILVMRKELKAEFAKGQFDQAMASFQRDCPVIVKNKSVFERDKRTVRYKYATLDSIVEQVRKNIAENNLSYTVKIMSDEKMLTAIVKISHISGHSEESSFDVPISNEQFMSDVQKYGARSTFAKRYAFVNSFGILTGDDDTDGDDGKTKEAMITESQVNKAIGLLDECMTIPQLKKVWTSLKKEMKAKKEVIQCANTIKSNIEENN